MGADRRQSAGTAPMPGGAIDGHRMRCHAMDAG
jgi:hypothetical protein